MILKNKAICMAFTQNLELPVTEKKPSTTGAPSLLNHFQDSKNITCHRSQCSATNMASLRYLMTRGTPILVHLIQRYNVLQEKYNRQQGGD
jgi:hypothetical protein